MEECLTCKRKLDNLQDPLSTSFGGDCAYCMLKAEVEIGDFDTARMVADSIAFNCAVLRDSKE